MRLRFPRWSWPFRILIGCVLVLGGLLLTILYVVHGSEKAILGHELDACVSNGDYDCVVQKLREGADPNFLHGMIMEDAEEGHNKKITGLLKHLGAKTGKELSSQSINPPKR